MRTGNVASRPGARVHAKEIPFSGTDPPTPRRAPGIAPESPRIEAATAYKVEFEGADGWDEFAEKS